MVPLNPPPVHKHGPFLQHCFSDAPPPFALTRPFPKPRRCGPICSQTTPSRSPEAVLPGQHPPWGRFGTARATNHYIVHPRNTPANHPPTEARMTRSKQHRGCRVQDPGTRGYRRWRTADYSHSARTAHGAPPLGPSASGTSHHSRAPMASRLPVRSAWQG